MKGRPPKPTEVKVREGNPGKRELAQPLLVAGRPELEELRTPPDYLPADCHDVWEQAVVKLVEAGIADRVDGPALEMMAVQYARWRQAMRAVDVTGLFTLGSAGQVKRHPAVDIEREATTMYLRMAEQFALTPVGRTRLGLAELHARRMQDEMGEKLGGIEMKPVGEVQADVTIPEADVVDEDD